MSKAQTVTSKARRTTAAAGQRPLGVAMILGALAALGVAFAIAAVEFCIKGSPLRNLFDLVRFNPYAGIETSELYQRFLGQVDRQEALLVGPLSFFAGGVTLARAAGPRYGRRSLLIAGAGTAVTLILLALAVPWGAILSQQHGHLHSGQIDGSVARNQVLWSSLWIVLCMAGVETGLRWRASARTRADAKAPPTPASR